MSKKSFKCILVIPDQHFPYHHKHIFKFLKAVKAKYRPDKVVNLGDELDLHSMSFHNHSPNLPGPHDEMGMAIANLKYLYKIFPEVDILESNHGSLVYRRAEANSLPKRVLMNYNQILEAPKGWRWHSDLVLYGSDGNPIYFCHGMSSDSLKNSKNRSMNFISGHWHSKFEIRYWANSLNLYWGVISGCLIDYKAMAFDYGRTMLDKPILGCTIIRNGHPILIPMILDKNGNWTGKLP
jgi:hypothetical protein